MNPGSTIKRMYPVVLLAIATSFATGQSHAFPSTGRILLHGPSAKGIFDQCSRPAPSDKLELWEPSAKDVDELEAALTNYLDAREKVRKPNPPKGTKYHRQYVGFIRNGERFIYGNFYPEAPEQFRKYEAQRPVQVCDGGRSYWGIVYRLKNNTFEEPQFNGEA